MGNGAKGYGGDGGSAGRAGLVEPNGLGLDLGHGTLFIADVSDHRVRAVDLGSGTMRTVAGTGAAEHSGDGGPAVRADVFGARAVKVGADGTLYIMERQGSCAFDVCRDIPEADLGADAIGDGVLAAVPVR